jgi:ankyrin repeat protein
MEDIRTLISSVDMGRLRQLLADRPELANNGIGLPGQESAVAHPLHRLCDGVFDGRYTDLDAREMAKVFVASGADVNGGDLKANQDSPLTAAASLSAEQTAIYYVDIGASLTHRGCYGGTALHWAAWCGRDLLVRKLIDAGAPIEMRCIDFSSTPLFWAIHGFKFGGEENRHQQIKCARMLLTAGAIRDTQNKDGLHILELLSDADSDLRTLLT